MERKGGIFHGGRKCMSRGRARRKSIVWCRNSRQRSVVTAKGPRSGGLSWGGGFEERCSWETEPRQNIQDHLLGQSLEWSEESPSLLLFFYFLKLPKLQKSWKENPTNSYAPCTGILRLLTPVNMSYWPFFCLFFCTVFESRLQTWWLNNGTWVSRKTGHPFSHINHISPLTTIPLSPPRTEHWSHTECVFLHPVHNQISSLFPKMNCIALLVFIWCPIKKTYCP